MSDLGTVAVVSLEAWDTTWRRNQHFAHQLIERGHADYILFVEPPSSTVARKTQVEDRITAIKPRLLAPRRVGGLTATAAALNAGELKAADLLWVNDAAFGRHLLKAGRPSVYDVTDDWRSSTQHPRVRRRQIATENVLARRARTVVCSPALRDLWHARYDVDAHVVANGADVTAIRDAVAQPLGGPGPHAVYVGTLHRDRLDLDLLVAVAQAVGTLHLVGPNALDGDAEFQLKQSANIELPGPVKASEVAGWLISADVLLCPHVITDFTLSLDAIKAHEYLATDRPIVATPTSGFTTLVTHEGVFIAEPADFVSSVRQALKLARRPQVSVSSWADQAALFADELSRADT